MATRASARCGCSRRGRTAPPRPCCSRCAATSRSAAARAPLLDLARRRLSALVATRDLVTLVALPPDVLAWVRAAAPADAAALPSSEYAIAASVGSLLARVDREVRLQLTADEAVALLEGLRCAREVLAMFQRPP